MGEANDLLSIGDLAEATGLSTHTLRVWERRYGQPEPLRLPSGHRRYTADQLRWLRRVSEALALGNRPRTVLGMDEAELGALLEEQDVGEDEDDTAELLSLCRGFDAPGMTAWLEERLQTVGMRAFLFDHLGRLLVGIGRAWADGRIGVRHEHFASVVLQDFLTRLRIEEGLPDNRPVVLTTLQNEEHALGLQLLALVAVRAGRSVRILGPNSPQEEILDAARECHARAVAVSVSLATGGVETDRLIAELRAGLPSDVDLVIGGRGARGVRRGPRGVCYLDGLEELDRWLRALDPA